MNNINEIESAFDLNDFVVASGYFRAQVEFFEEKYREQFHGGWGEFYAAYSKGLTNKGNLDYDEWAFLCEHFLKESWQPPGGCAEFQEEPEKSSRAFLLEDTRCSIRNSILGLSNANSLPVTPGQQRLARH